MGAQPVPPGGLIGLTSGDPAGIGPEIALKAWDLRADRAIPPFAIYADPDMLAARARCLGLSVPIEVCKVDEALAVSARGLPVIAVPLARPSEPGKPEAVNSAAVIQSIEHAVADCASGQIAAIVTNPIAKAVLYKTGFAHPGHTEFLAALAAELWPSQIQTPVMMIVSETLRVVPLTIHVALKAVPTLITRQLILSTINTVYLALIRDFGISRPRIAVTGLNPHAGEDGAFGSEERDVITPAIRDLQGVGLTVTGPHSADTMFHAAARAQYDAAIAMYHDQALIPIKTLAFDEGVNVTLGLPFVRTSPDHGTAFDIAAAGRASPTSLIAALKLAGTMVARRQRSHV